MLKKRPIINYFFSGTGNTERLVQAFSKQLIHRGYDSKIYKMEQGYRAIQEPFTLGLIFPVAVQSTNPLVWEFIYQLPRVEERDVFMFDTMESYSGGIVGPLKKVLTKKGYHCIGAREFTMSSILSMRKKKKEMGKVKDQRALQLVIDYADDLVNNRAKWNRIPIFSDVIRSISKHPNVWKSICKEISIGDGCVNCRICLQNCPVLAIESKQDQISIDQNKCISCFRCVSMCPKNSILFKGRRLGDAQN